MDDMDVAEQIAHLHHHGLSDQEIWGSLGIEPDELVRLALNLMSKSTIASTSKQRGSAPAPLPSQAEMDRWESQ